MKPNGTHQRFVYDDDDINILGGSVRTVRKSTDDLSAANKENGLEGNSDKTNYIVMSGHQNAGKVTI